MSVQGDPELSDLVAQTLENSGVLAKIRAELRASVFLVLEEHEAFKGKSFSASNQPLKEFIATPEGKTIVNLIQEFLEYFGLEFTARVFEPEIQTAKSCEYNGRDKLAQDLKLSSGKKSPLIAQVLQDSKQFFPLTSSSKESHLISKKDKTKDEKSAEECTDQVTKPDSAINNPVKTVESHPLNIEGKPLLSSNTPPPFQNHLKKPDRLELMQTNLKPNGSSLSSLGGLPPLGLPQNNQNNKFSINKSAKPVTHDIKALLELGSDGGPHD
ncbi:centrosomal protein 43-like isoform X2 [Macrosteles quadrilineatus]|uniref:centrosomal protein 43-like isoform X2 n=1 Tax=Macrosteles quadrilineatus TaxID=74068 RepID=UPI0023E287DC|nr:centrosomal protein 43-like isoform X2 [Macrosteles quadrilineatus]